MKIAFLAGANSIHSVRWVKFFADRGHQIVWISFAPPIPEATDSVEKVKFYEIKPSPLSDINGLFAIRYLPSAVKQIKKILQAEKPDVLHVHSAGTYGLAGALADFHPMILTPWGSDILLGGLIRKFALMFVVDRADTYTCDGENTFQKLIGLGAEREKIHFIRFGTDVDKFRPSQSKEVELPQGSSTSKKLKVISLRSLISIYDIETLIKAAAIVVKETPNVEFVIAGDGNQKEYLLDLTAKLNLTMLNLVRFVGRVNNEELPALLQAADIYVSTALSDSGLSASTAEAMATGLPVVVTDTGDNKDWVDNNFVIPVKSPEMLAQKLITLINDEKLRAAQGARNRQIIEDKNNYQIEMEKVEKVYENLVTRS
ncbi:MAG TPA: glycosyltransferase family 4 protein [Candidatus Paceibacterota bacterium]|nr:glycosyltransferase family 4 protein [Candidatus Paceibacterota bacterium]